MLSKISSLVGGDGVFSMLRQPATSVVFLALHGLAKGLSQGVHRLDALISNPIAKTKEQQEIDVLLKRSAQNSAHALRGALEGKDWEPDEILSNQRRSDETLTELKSDLQRLGLPKSDPLKMGMAAFLKKHVER